MAERSYAASLSVLRACSRGVILTLMLSLAGAVASFATAPAAPAVHVITIEGMRFSPSDLTVRRGDRILWTNKDLVPHTATADAKHFDSREIAANASWTYTAGEPGVYAYVCTYHPTMKAMLRVKP